MTAVNYHRLPDLTNILYAVVYLGYENFLEHHKLGLLTCVN